MKTKKGKLRLVQSYADPAVWNIVGEDVNDVKGYLLAYVDDFLITSTSDIVDSLQKHIGEMVTSSGETWKTSTQTTISAKHPGTIKYLSIDISIEQSGKTTLGQHQYCQEMLEKWNMDSCKGTNSINLDKEEFDVGAQDEEENLSLIHI